MPLVCLHCLAQCQARQAVSIEVPALSGKGQGWGALLSEPARLPGKAPLEADAASPCEEPLPAVLAGLWGRGILLTIIWSERGGLTDRNATSPG